MGALRNPFVTAFLVALVASVIALVAAVAVTFSDINDAAVPDSVWGRHHSDLFREFLRRASSGAVEYVDITASDITEVAADIPPAPPIPSVDVPSIPSPPPYYY